MMTQHFFVYSLIVKQRLSPIETNHSSSNEGKRDVTFVCLRPAADAVDACIHSDMSADAADYEAESWSLTVDNRFCRKQDKRAVKRQDVIYGERAFLIVRVIFFRRAGRDVWRVGPQS